MVVWLWAVCPAQGGVFVGVYVPSTDFVGVMCDGYRHVLGICVSLSCASGMHVLALCVCWRVSWCVVTMRVGHVCTSTL